jgi:hypothetical protein
MWAHWIVQKPDRSPFNSAKSLTEGSSRFSIKLKGSVKRGTWTKEGDTYWLHLPGASEPTLFHADCELSDSTCPEEICCLLLAYVDCVYNSPAGPMKDTKNLCLALSPIRGLLNRYCRIGCVDRLEFDGNEVTIEEVEIV